MKKSIIILGAAVLLGLTCSSCRFITIDQDKLGKDNITISSGVDLGNKDVIKGSDREVSRDFSSLGEIRTLVIDGSADVTVRQSENPVLSIELPANLEDYLRVDYDNGKCNIYLDRSHRYTNASFNIILGTSTLEKLSINGASDIEMGRMSSERVLALRAFDVRLPLSKPCMLFCPWNKLQPRIASDGSR